MHGEYFNAMMIKVSVSLTAPPLPSWKGSKSLLFLPLMSISDNMADSNASLKS